MTNDTDRLEKEAEGHRSKLDSTLDELRGRFSAGQIVDEVASYLKEGQGSDMAKNFGRQVRDNPLALGLVGAGMAWLFAGSGARAEGRHLKDRYDGWRNDAEDDRFDDRFPGSGAAEPRGAGHAGAKSAFVPQARPVSQESMERSSFSPSSGPGMAERAKSATANAGRGVSDAAARTGEGISNAAGSARDTASRYGHEASDAAWRGEQATMRQARRAGRSVLSAFRDEPLIMGGVALALGAAVGASLPATRREDEWMGEVRDDLRDDAFAYGRDTLNKAQDVTAKTYEAASEKADEKGLKPDNDSDETIAEKVGSVARTAAETAEAETRKERS
ncbi:DUF3618 domain-containing protein [Fulvimarina sp. MAC8]|uniref:DUF3618 domain-containing protein n=1 Tax=Fulvimarina sp. MAC8 TaxID=3162874 RepID=UPI0032F04109